MDNVEKKTRPGRNGGTLNTGGTTNGGRPRKLPAIDEIGAMLLSEERSGRIALEAIIASMIAKAVKGDPTAAKLVLDRFYGQSKQQVEHAGEIKTDGFLDLPIEKRLAILEIINKPD